MKYLLIFFTFFSITTNAQNSLNFDKTNVQCEDKWVAFQKGKDSTYIFGFIYIDLSAGLTFRREGNFKADNKGNFIRTDNPEESKITMMLVRLEPSRVAIAEIPESKFKELKIDKTPSWLKIYKSGENTVENLYKKGYWYNAWNESAKALEFLEKAEKLDANFKGLQTELAFSYNALQKFDKAEIALKKAVANDPNDCYTYKELAYTYTQMQNFDNVIQTYTTMTTKCKETNYVIETAYNLAYEYFKLKDKKQFDKWKTEAEKWAKSENQFTKNLKLMDAELNK